MAEKTPGPDQILKEPQWYTKASREAKRDGERLREQIVKGLFPQHPDTWPEDEQEHAAPYVPFGLLHQACVGMAELTYQASVKSVQQAANARGKPNDDPQGANKHAYRRVYKIARNLEHGLAEITPIMVRDAIVECVLPLAQADQDEKAVVNLLEVWRQQHNVPPEQILPALVRQHQQNIENRNRSVKLDAESAMQMPKRFVEKTWTLSDANGESKTYALHMLDTDAQLDLEGFMMDNCVGGDSWKEQIKVRTNGKPQTIILSIGSEVPQGIAMEDIEGLSDRTLESVNQERYRAENAVLEDQMSYMEDRDGNRRREEIVQQYYTRQKELEEKLKLNVCRIPAITIEYNVDAGRIMQIVGFSNEFIGGNHPLAHILIEAIAEMVKKIPIKTIDGLQELESENGPLEGCVLTSSGIAKKPSKLEADEKIVWHPKTYYPDDQDTVADVRAWARLPIGIQANFLTLKQCAALTDVEGSLLFDSGLGTSRFLLPNLRTVKGRIQIEAIDELDMPELIEVEKITVLRDTIHTPTGLRPAASRIIAPKLDQSKIVHL